MGTSSSKINGELSLDKKRNKNFRLVWRGSGKARPLLSRNTITACSKSDNQKWRMSKEKIRACLESMKNTESSVSHPCILPGIDLEDYNCHKKKSSRILFDRPATIKCSDDSDPINIESNRIIIKSSHEIVQKKESKLDKNHNVSPAPSSENFCRQQENELSNSKPLKGSEEILSALTAALYSRSEKPVQAEKATDTFFLSTFNGIYSFDEEKSSPLKTMTKYTETNSSLLDVSNRCDSSKSSSYGFNPYKKNDLLFRQELLNKEPVSTNEENSLIINCLKFSKKAKKEKSKKALEKSLEKSHKDGTKNAYKTKDERFEQYLTQSSDKNFKYGSEENELRNKRDNYRHYYGAPPSYLDYGRASSSTQNNQVNRTGNPYVDRLSNVDVIEEITYNAPDGCNENNSDCQYYMVCDDCGEMELVQCPPENKAGGRNPVTYTRRQRFNFQNEESSCCESSMVCTCSCCRAGLRRNPNCVCMCCKMNGKLRRLNEFDEVPVGKNPILCYPSCCSDEEDSDEEDEKEAIRLMPKESGVYYFDVETKKFERKSVRTPSPIVVKEPEPPVVQQIIRAPPTPPDPVILPPIYTDDPCNPCNPCNGHLPNCCCILCCPPESNGNDTNGTAGQGSKEETKN